MLLEAVLGETLGVLAGIFGSTDQISGMKVKLHGRVMST
jgi:hypothetical protein